MTTKEIKNTPFKVVEQNGKFYVVIGNFAIYEANTQEDAELAVIGKSWELLFNLCTMVTEQTIKKYENERKS